MLFSAQNVCFVDFLIVTLLLTSCPMLWGISNSPKNSKSSWYHRSFSQRHTLPSFFLIVLGVAFVVVFHLFCFVRLFVYFQLELSDTIAASIFNMKVKVSFHNFLFFIF